MARKFKDLKTLPRRGQFSTAGLRVDAKVSADGLCHPYGRCGNADGAKNTRTMALSRVLRDLCPSCGEKTGGFYLSGSKFFSRLTPAEIFQVRANLQTQLDELRTEPKDLKECAEKYTATMQKGRQHYWQAGAEEVLGWTEQTQEEKTKLRVELGRMLLEAKPGDAANAFFDTDNLIEISTHSAIFPQEALEKLREQARQLQETYTAKSGWLMGTAVFRDRQWLKNDKFRAIVTLYEVSEKGVYCAPELLAEPLIRDGIYSSESVRSKTRPSEAVLETLSVLYAEGGEYTSIRKAYQAAKALEAGAVRKS